MLAVWFIHGAGATKRSFAWLSRQLPTHRANYFEYDLQDSLTTCIDAVSADITEQGPGIIIGHSLGGLIAAGVIGHPGVLGLVTLCAPFGGLPFARFWAIMRSDQLFRNLAPYNPVLRAIGQDVEASTKPHLPIIATHGLPTMSQPNDGVLPISSQTALRGPDYRSRPLNHFEVLLDDEVARLIGSFMLQFDLPIAPAA